MDLFADKLAAFVTERRKALGYTSREAFAADAGVSSSTITKIERAEGRVPNRSTRRLLAAALLVPLNVLEAVARGEDVAVPAPQKPSAGHGYNANAIPGEARHANLRPVPMLGKSVAGHGIEEADRGAEADRYVYIPPNLVQGDPDAFAVEVTGDSMKPYLQVGDWVVCSAKAAETPGGLYFIQHTGALDEANRLKLVFSVPDDDTVLELRSTNPKYPPVRVRKEDIGTPALVLYVVRPAERLGLYG